MAISVFDLFKVGIGPSSSHTVGPMRAARLFTQALEQHALMPRVAKLRIELYGSLAATGKGHGTDTALLLGLAGHEPDTVDVERIPALLQHLRSGVIPLAGTHPISFNAAQDLVFLPQQSLPFHANAMRCLAHDPEGSLLRDSTYYSVGGGFIVSDAVAADPARQQAVAPTTDTLPLPFNSANELLRLTRKHGLTIAELMRRNERCWRSNAEIDAELRRIWGVMQACVQRGCRTRGLLPGGFQVRRRAAQLAERLGSFERGSDDPLRLMDWVNLWALAVNEENAAGGRVVTAPTNGAAGIIPAVLHYYTRTVASANERGVIDFLLTAGAIGILYKKNASISGAEVGCQGEVGVACSMAAGALCAVLGGTPAQVENAAEIGMEHHLGLTCDPVGGLVQIPCIERNAIAAVKAINAARLALHGDGVHHVSLDQVIKTMHETGADMLTKYKETALGGLAVNIIEC
ncbi:MAG: L-serine ammonia-lyase [Pigmentiphaga sp.]